MPNLEDLKKNKSEISFVENKIAGILRPKADPYKELAKAERIKSSTYELPKGMSEQDAMALTLGAIFNDQILDTMYTSSSAEGSKRSFGAVYVIENVFVRIEDAGRLGNVPYKIGEARENAARAFQKYANGDTSEVKEMAATLVNISVELIKNYLISDSATYKAYGMVTRMAVDLLDNPEMELKGLLPESAEKHLRIFADVYEMKKDLQDAEIQLRENVPPKNSTERETLIKKILSENALISRFTQEIYDRNSVMTDMAFGIGKKLESQSNAKIKADLLTKDLDFVIQTREFNNKYLSETMLPAEILLETKENKNSALSSYSEAIEKTEIYKKLMEADEAELDKLLEYAKNEKLPEVNALKDELEKNELKTQEISQHLIGEFEKKAFEALPRIISREEKQEKLNEVTKGLKAKKGSTNLIGTVNLLKDYLYLIQDTPLENVDVEKYHAYLESMYNLVAQTEKFYEKDSNGEYTPLTPEGLTDLQKSYKEAYYLAKEAGALRGVCDILENNIIALGTISKKNPTSLPQAMEAIKNIMLDISENKIPSAINSKNFAASISYTDINGEERKGSFVNRTEQKTVKAEIYFITSDLDQKYKKIDRLGMILRKNAANEALTKKLTWKTCLPENIENLSREEAKEAFFNKLMENIGDNLKDYKELIENNKEDAVSYFLELVEHMDKAIQKESIYREELYDLKIGSLRIDNRSKAMSTVADLIGTPNLVARTQNMDITTGKDTYSGTFIEDAKGIDVSNLPKDHPMRTYNNEVYDHDKGLKSLADLQVLDYICQTVNRDSQNMAYQFDTTDPNDPKFIGVQGKASNSCFVLATDDKNLTTLDNLGVISQSVFDSIMQIDPEMFVLALSSQGLEKREVEAAYTRLEQLKTKVLEDEKYFADMPSTQLEKGRIRIVKDEDFKKLSFEKILDAAPNARAFQNVKDDIMNGVPVSEKAEKERRMEEEAKKLISNKNELLKSSEVSLNSPLYYQKLGQDFKKMLLETVRADDSKLRGSSNEYKNVQQSLRETIELIDKIHTPKEADIRRLNDSMKKIMAATNAYEKHKEKKSSGSAYEKERIKTIARIEKAVTNKHSIFAKEYAIIEDKDSIQQKNEVNKHQIKLFVSNLMTWNEQQPKENQERALATAILAGSMADYAFKCFGVGKKDGLFEMTQEQFEKKVTELQQSEKFQNYYRSIDKEKLAENFASQKPIESYLEDFKKVSKEPPANSQPQTSHTKEFITITNQDAAIIPN